MVAGEAVFARRKNLRGGEIACESEPRISAGIARHKRARRFCAKFVYGHQSGLGRTASPSVASRPANSASFTWRAANTLRRSTRCCAPVIWMDAAYVAERVLTTDELKTYVDRNWPPFRRRKMQAKQARYFRRRNRFKPREEIRWLLARRIARETGGPMRNFIFRPIIWTPTKNFSSNCATDIDETFAGESALKNFLPPP